MTKIVYLTLCFLTMIAFSFVSAQDAGVRGDYDRYVRLFKRGQEPNWREDASWRSSYARNDWKRYADGTEFREPIPEAQVLVGLYLLNTVNSGLDNNISDIVQQKGLLNKAFAESVVLDQIAGIIEEDLEGLLFYSDAELVGDFRGIGGGARARMERLLRQRMTSSVPGSFRNEIKAVVDMFTPDIDEGVLAKYRVIREKMSVLDTLADSFAFNWNDERKKKELEHLMENKGVQSKATQRANLEIEARLKNLSMEEEQEIRGRHLQVAAQEELDMMVAKHKAHKYIVGVYQGQNYHVGNLKRIYRYFFDAANQNNPIAQYHLALFLLYFGDILGMTREDVEQKCKDWLEKAYDSELTHDSVVEINTLLDAERRKAERRKEQTVEKIETMLKLEHERMDMIENALIQQAKRATRINEVQERLIEEMERESERRAITQREFLRSLATVEAARLSAIAIIEAQRSRRMPTRPNPLLGW